MNKSKLILAMLREGDYAHPGEVEAIHLAFDSIPKNPQHLLLDIGCGLGGTANYLHQHGWGKVIGLDIDEDVVNYAKQIYPDCSFLHTDVITCKKFLSEKKFDVIYLFSSFFCFTDKTTSLRVLHELANSTCRLVIFDYSTHDAETITNPFSWSKIVKHFEPISLTTFKQTLNEAGWDLQQTVDISEQFIAWYSQLLTKFDQKKHEIVTRFGDEIFASMRAGYANLLDLLKANQIGGVIVHAKNNGDII